jgi:c(7)-type cytochrome triheme protein
VFFFTSCIAAGLAMTIIESFLSFRAFGKRLEKDLLMGLSRVIVVVLAVYLVFKFQDLYRRDNLHLVFELNRESVLFWGEMGLGVILPMALLFSERIRQNEVGLFFSALLVVVGFIVSRLNVSITGMLHSETYFPKWTEIVITVALVVLGFTIFALAVKHFNVFPKEELAKGEERHPVFTGKLVLTMWALLLIGMITYGLTKNYQDNHSASASPNPEVVRVAEPLTQELKLPGDFTYPLGEGSPGPVLFSHENHVFLQDEPNCTTCHSDMFDILKDNKLDLKAVTMDAMYEGQSCGKCHNSTDAFSVEECESCHTVPAGTW